MHAILSLEAEGQLTSYVSVRYVYTHMHIMYGANGIWQESLLHVTPLGLVQKKPPAAPKKPENSSWYIAWMNSGLAHYTTKATSLLLFKVS